MNHQQLTKLKPSKLMVTVNIVLVDLFIRQTLSLPNFPAIYAMYNCVSFIKCFVIDSYREELTHSSHSANVAQSLPITVPLYTTYNNRQQQQPSEHQDEKVSNDNSITI